VYVTDTISHQVYFVPAASLAPYQRQVLIGSEIRSFFSVLGPRGRGFVTQQMATSLQQKHYNLEAAICIAP